MQELAFRLRLDGDKVDELGFIFLELGFIFLAHATIYYTRAHNFGLRGGNIRRIVVTLPRFASQVRQHTL